MSDSGAKYSFVVNTPGGGEKKQIQLKIIPTQTLPFDQQWITAKGVTEMRSMGGSVISGFLISMAAIPILMGMLIFMPIVIPLALVCVVLESSGK